jgi:hypothetical protein
VEPFQGRAQYCFVRVRTVDCIGRVGKLRRVVHSVELSVVKIRLYRTQPEVARAAGLEDIVASERAQPDKQARVRRFREADAVIEREICALINIDEIGPDGGLRV